MLFRSTSMKTSLLLPICLLIAGCTPDQGDFKYIGQKPSVKLTVVSTKYEPAKETYESAKLELSGVAQQTRPFPVKFYSVGVACEGKLSNDKPFTCHFEVEMKDGAGSFSTKVYLDSGQTTPNLKLVSLTVKQSYWSPPNPANVELTITE